MQKCGDEGSQESGQPRCPATPRPMIQLRVPNERRRRHLFPDTGTGLPLQETSASIAEELTAEIARQLRVDSSEWQFATQRTETTGCSSLSGDTYNNTKTPHGPMEL